jgi:methionyl-tRNA formyltransferase
MRIAIAGSGRLAYSLMQGLRGGRHELVALVQNGRATRGFNRTLVTACTSVLPVPDSVTGLAARARMPIVWIDRMTGEELAPLRKLEPDVLLVGGFSIILKRPILDLPRIGCVNVHSSLLPKHRGPNPFSAVILAGEAETGVTFHVMDEGIDTGDILEQHAFPITAEDTALTTYNKACSLAGEHIAAVMDRVEREGLWGSPQDNTVATYDQKLDREGAQIDWRKPARYIERLMRAAKPFIVPSFSYAGRTIFVTQIRWDAVATHEAPGTVVIARPFVRVATGEGTVTLVVAYTRTPLPWIWPAPWNRPRAGEKLL